MMSIGLKEEDRALLKGVISTFKEAVSVFKSIGEELNKNLGILNKNMEEMNSGKKPIHKR